PEHKCISGEMSRKDVHKTRRSCQAILVGVNTVIADDPMLTARPDRGRGLLRVVLDNKLEMPIESKLLNTVEQSDVLVVTTEDTFRSEQKKVEQIISKGAEVFAVKGDLAGLCEMVDVLEELGRLGVQRLLVEGGREVIGTILRNDLADELNIYIAPKIYGSKGRVDIYDTLAEFDLAGDFLDAQTGLFGEDVKVRAILKEY
ncbi:MAG TPA: RibD family protein, partial [Sedimentisphaerales bacterium]|nr:RibD family protein [Sedimentisphaerales bacterium]